MTRWGYNERLYSTGITRTKLKYSKFVKNAWQKAASRRFVIKIASIFSENSEVFKK